MKNYKNPVGQGAKELMEFWSATPDINKCAKIVRDFEEWESHIHSIDGMKIYRNNFFLVFYMASKGLLKEDILNHKLIVTLDPKQQDKWDRVKKKFDKTCAAEQKAKK